MSIALASTVVARHKGAVGHVCARRDWNRPAMFRGQGTVVTKHEPQPTTYEGKAPDA